MNELAQAREHCAQILQESGSNFLLSFSLLAKTKRQALMSVYAFCRLIDDIADHCSDVAIAEAKLFWWQQEIYRVFDDSGASEPPQHPVGLCLRADREQFNLVLDCFLAILEGVRSDLNWGICADREQLLQYCYRVSCCVGLLSIEIFGYRRDEIRDYAIQLGYAMQLTNIIRDVRQDAQRGRVYLPATELSAHGVDAGQLLQARQTTEGLRVYLRQLGTEVTQMFDQAFAVLQVEEYRQQLAGIVMGQTYMQLLREIASDDFRVMEYRLALPPHSKLLILLKTVLRAYLRIAFRTKRHL